MPKSKSAGPKTPVSNAPLTALELQIVCEFVTAAAGTYVDHSCNDFELPDTPTRRALVQAAIDLDKQGGNDQDKFVLKVRKRRVLNFSSFANNRRPEAY